MLRHAFGSVTGVTAVVAALACLVAPPVGADAFGDAATTCSGQVYTRPFLRFGDPAAYVLAPGGTFDGEPGWALGGGAVLADGNEPFLVSGTAGDGTSLLLAPGSQATSLPLCVTVFHPTIRFVVRSSNRAALLGLRVLYEDMFGRLTTLEFARISATDSWFPTAPLLFLANAFAPLAVGGQTAVAFQFVALSGTWQVDDVYVDPYKSR